MADHPFLYFHHGELDPDLVDKVGAVALGFAAPVATQARLQLQATVPDAFAGFFKWSDTLFTSESLGDIFDSIVYGGEPGDAGALKKFAASVEAWVRTVHAKHPLVFFMGPTASLPGDAWDAWTWKRAPEVLLPFFEKYADRHPESLQTDDDDNDASEPMANFGPVDKVQMQSVLQIFDAKTLGGGSKEGQARAKKLLARYGLGKR